MDESAQDKRMVLKYEIYHPYLPSYGKYRSDEIPLTKLEGFTEGKEYPIYEEKLDRNAHFTSLNAFQYLTEDDGGKPRRVHACYFIPRKPKLIEATDWVKELVGREPSPEVQEWFEKNSNPMQDANIYEEWEKMSKGQNLNWSGIPLAILKFKELIKDAEEFKLLAGVPTHGNELLDKILKLESQMKAMQQSFEDIKKIARYLSVVDLTGKNVT